MTVGSSVVQADLRQQEVEERARAESVKAAPRSAPAQAKRHLVIDLSTGKSRPVIARTPLLSTATSDWHGISLEHHRGGAAEALNFVAPQHVVVVQIHRAAECEMRNGFGRFHQCRLAPGNVVIFPAMAPHSVRTEDIGEFIAVRLDPRFVQCSAHDLIGCESLELTTHFGIHDPLLAASALALKAEAEAGTSGGRTYVDSLATAMAVHLVRHYSTGCAAVEPVSGGLTPNQLRRVVDFIHASIQRDISLAALAASVGLSPYHFARMFKRSTGLPPHQFVVRCRVEKAKELLLSQHALADVALRVGFCGQSHLNTHFKRAYGVTPKAFRQRMFPQRREE